MSSPMLPIEGSPDAAATLPTPPRGQSSPGSFRTELAAQQPLLRGESFPSSPPQEVLDSIRPARRIYHELRADGHQLHFSTDRRSGRITIEVKDRDGKIIRTLSPSEAVDLATEKAGK
jgi:hypothetical protein